MHECVELRVARKREPKIKPNNKHTNIVEQSVEVGDCVLVCTVQKKRLEKKIRWAWLRRMGKAVLVSVYTGQSLTTNKLETVHTEWMTMYKEIMKDKIFERNNDAQHTETRFGIVRRLQILS